MVETQKFKSRFTDEVVLSVRFTGKQDQLIEILDWVIESGGRAQGNIRADEGLDLMIHERGVGLIKVKPGELIIKSESGGFEIHSVLTFTQMYEKVAPVIRVIEKPVILEAMQFDGGIQNEKDILEWLATSNHVGKFKHTIPGTSRVYYRIEMANSLGLIDIPLNSWIVKSGDTLRTMSNEEFFSTHQRID